VTEAADDRRARLVEHALTYLDHVVCWGKLDCSELVAVAYLHVGLPDYRRTWRARDFAKYLKPTDKPELGDLGFYGHNWERAQHVVIYIGDGRILSASGATSFITDEKTAAAKGARVRIYSTHLYRRDIPFLGWRRTPLPPAADVCLTPH
jgi:cell wall-associated NlpC family hydrolase